MDPKAVEAVGVLAALLLITGGMLHKLGFLRFGKDDASRCQDPDCQDLIRKHDRRLEDGDKSFQDVNDKLDAMADEQAKQSKLLRRINVNFAYVKVQLKKMGIEGELPGVEDDLTEG